ncbi:Ubiquitin carboxyl-terminal hydrolase 25 [Tetrabaena socialis]|uniref:ubiquitinyl hydrolase 1 n=1 Tax=Tetrabaena socialis TaxID=47790 RepID=A0A2J7ZMB4_9CHLO|nr:Ubiquitin carboxyl-terminal hydrolase 25 [Tetrabaena socialis]|eukprot:PNH01408.1 Ubiquitin carboxyl-terminal hydrolase 25 [Tetrabaena socialis]
MSTSSPIKAASTTVSDLFGGVLQSEIVCLECGKVSDKYDHITTVTHREPLSNGGRAPPHTVKSAFDLYTKGEILNGRERYMCEVCKKLVKGLKELTIHDDLDDPDVLVLHLNRFTVSTGGVSIKNQALNLEPYMTFQGIYVSGQGESR